MAEEVARLVAVVEANLKGFTKGMEQMQREADRRFGAVEKRMRQSERGFANFGRSIRNSLLGGISLVGIQRFVSAIGEMAGNLQDTSEALGIGTDELQAWAVLAGRAGIGQEQFNKALGAFAGKLGEAQLKGGAFKKFLDGIGVGTKGTPQEVFLRIADAVKNTADQSQRAAIVSEAFGAKMVKFTAVAQQGAAALKAQQIELAKLGFIAGGDVLKKIEKLGDQWEDLKKKLLVTGANALSPLIDEISSPAFQNGLQAFADGMSEVAVAIARMAPHLGTLTATLLALRFGGPVAAAIAGMLGLSLEAYRRQTGQIQDSIAKLEKDLANAQDRLRRREPGAAGQVADLQAQINRQKAQAAGIPFAVPGKPANEGGIDRTGQLNTDAENAKTLVDQSRADLEAARADLIRASGESAAAIEQNLARRYEIERDNIIANTDAAIRAAEEKKDAEITALEAQLQQGKVSVEQFNQIRINKELEFDTKRAELVEKQRADTAKLYDAEFERALELSRKLEDLRRDALENRAQAERRAQESRSELEIAKEQANTSIFAPGGDSEAVLDLKRKLIEETAALEEQEVQDRLERNLESLEREKDDLEARGEKWAEYEQARVDATKAAEAEIQQIRNEGAQQQVQIDDQVNKQRQDNLEDSLNTISSLTSSSNDTLKAIGKAAAIAQATMDGIVAVNKALAALPPPFNFALAAAVGAAVGANIAKIAALEKGGRVQAGVPYIVGEKRPELFVPDQAGRVLPSVPQAMASKGTGATANTFHIDARGATPGVERLIRLAVLEAVAISDRNTRRNFARNMVETQRDHLF